MPIDFPQLKMPLVIKRNSPLAQGLIVACAPDAVGYNAVDGTKYSLTTAGTMIQTPFGLRMGASYLYGSNEISPSSKLRSITNEFSIFWLGSLYAANNSGSLFGLFPHATDTFPWTLLNLYRGAAGWPLGVAASAGGSEASIAGWDFHLDNSAYKERPLSLAVACRSGFQRAYRDGYRPTDVTDSSATYSTISGYTSDMGFGTKPPFSASEYTALGIIWDRVLSDTEIATLHADAGVLFETVNDSRSLYFLGAATSPPPPSALSRRRVSHASRVGTRQKVLTS